MNRTQTDCISKKPIVRRFLRVAGLASWIGWGSTQGGVAQAAEPLSEHAATFRMCEEGPAVSIARARRSRGSADSTAASVLPNPSIVAEHQGSLTGPTEHETIVGLSVPLGIGGRRFLLQEAALERESQSHAEAEAGLFESALAFRESYVRAATEHARVELLSARQSLLEDLSQTIQGLARGGEAAGYDLLRQQALARIHGSTLESAKARALALRAGLEVLTGASIELTPERVDVRARATGPESRVDSSPRASGRIRALQAAARASSLEARAANRRWIPDLEVFAGYRKLTTGSDTGHGVSLSLSVPVTFFDHGQGDAARADAERALALAYAAKLQQERELESKTARVLLSGLAAALGSAQEARERALEVEAMSRRLYAAGEATITELLEAFRAAEEAELAQLALEEEIATARIRLMRAQGSMFDPALDRACRSTRGRSP